MYLISGQSNGAGYTTFKASDLKLIDERLINGFDNIIYAGDAQSTSDFGTVHSDIDWTSVCAGFGMAEDKIGAEAGMALKLSEYYNRKSDRKAAIIKFAHGGTNLLDSIIGENTCEGNWVSPSYEKTIEPKSKGNLTGGLYGKFITFVAEHIIELKNQGFSPIIKGIFWMQGENDIWQPDEYRKALTMLISDMRNDLGKAVNRDLSQMAFIIGEISESFGDAYADNVARNRTFIAAQNAVAEELNNVYTVKSGKLNINILENGVNVAVGTDMYHFNQNDMLEMGALVGACVLENILDVL